MPIRCAIFFLFFQTVVLAELPSLLKDIAKVDLTQQDTILKALEKNVQELEQVVASQTEQLKQDIDQKNTQLKKRAEKDAQHIFASYQKQAAALKAQLSEHIVDLKKDAAKRIIDLVDSYEARAMKARQAARRKNLDQLESKPTAEIETDFQLLRKEFVQDLSYVESVIKRGEREQLAQDLLLVIKKQEAAFDRQLKDDQEYALGPSQALIMKKDLMHVLASSHEQSLKQLEKKYAMFPPSLPMPTLSLQLLYDVANFLQAKNVKFSMNIIGCKPTEEESQALVESLLKRYEKPVQITMAPQMTVAQKIDHIVTMESIDKKKRNRLLLESRAKELLEAQLHLRQTQEMMKNTTRQVQALDQKISTTLQENNKLRNIILDSEKTKLAMQLDLERSRDKQNKGQQDLKEAQDTLQQIKKRCAQTTQKVAILEDLVDRQGFEKSLVYDMKKTLAGEQLLKVTKEQRDTIQSFLQEQKQLVQQQKMTIESLGQAIEKIENKERGGAGIGEQKTKEQDEFFAKKALEQELDNRIRLTSMLAK